MAPSLRDILTMYPVKAIEVRNESARLIATQAYTARHDCVNCDVPLQQPEFTATT